MESVSEGTALVTGSSSGIGEGIAKLLAAMGWKVIVTGRRQGELKRVADDIARSGGNATHIPADLADRRQVESFLKRVSEDFSPIDVLVNSAGRVDLQYIHELDMVRWDSNIELNLRVPAMLCAAILPSMRERRKGYIINISSEAGVYDYAGMGAYGVSKHALCALTELIQNENQHLGIKAWAICPGNVSTARTRNLSTKEEADCFLHVDDVLSIVRLLLTQGDNVKMGPTILIRPMNSYADPSPE